MLRHILQACLATAILIGLGCNQCGERRRLFDRFRDDDDGPVRSIDRAPPRDCDPCRPVSNTRAAGSYGQPMLGSPVSATAMPLSGGGFPIGSYPSSVPGGIVYPSGPGVPIYPGSMNPRGADELPQPGSYQPGGQYAMPRPTESGRMNTAPRSNAFTSK